MKLLTKLLMRAGGIEPTERFFWNLSNPVGGGTIAVGQGTCTITQVGNLNPIINVNRSSGVAPFVVVFDALATQVLPSMTADPFKDVLFTWDFGDPAGGAVWPYGTNPGGSSKNLACGPVAAHCFETDGTYTPTVHAQFVDYVTGALTTASATVTITVTNADVVFAGASTICVANGTLPVAGIDGVPAGALCYNQSDWATVVGYGGTGKRVLLKHGDSWTATGAAGTVPVGTTGIYGMYGTGAKPHVELSGNVQGFIVGAGRVDYRIMDFDFHSAQTGTTQAENQYRIPIDTVNASYTTILRCNGEDFYTSVQAQLSDDTSVIGCDFQDTFVDHGNMNAFFYLGHRVVLLGNRFSRSFETHTVRISGSSRYVVSNNYMDLPGPTRHVFTVRGWEAVSPATEYGVVNDNVMHGDVDAGYALYCGPVNTATNETIRNLIYERNYLTSESPAYTAVLAVQSGMIFRSNIVKSRHETSVCVLGGNGHVSAPPTDVWIYGNTCYKDSIAITPNYSTFVLSGTVSGVKFGNNLSYAPNCTHDAGGSGSQASMIYLTLGATSGDYSFIGTDTNDTQLNTVRPWAAVTPVTHADFTPAPASYAIGSGTALPTSSDFFNTLITDPRDMGAIQ